jgi:hypothetical protein
MDEQNSTPFRVAKYFAEHVPQALESLQTDPEGMYQIVYRVGDVMISAHVWREPQTEASASYSEADLRFLKDCHVSPDEHSPDEHSSDALL